MDNARLHAGVLTALMLLPLAGRAGKDRFEPGEAAPTFMLKALNPAEAGLDKPQVAVNRYFEAGSEERKKLLLLTFFATYCEPCKKEMPYVAALYEAYRDKGFQVLSVTIDKEADDIAFAKDLADRSGVTFPVLSDRFSVVARRYFISKLPCVYLIDGDGKVITVEVGYDKESQHKLLANVRKGLGEPADAPLPESLARALKALEAAEAGGGEDATATAEKVDEPAPAHLLVVGNGATLRAKPAAKAKASATLAVGEVLKPRGQENGWYQVRISKKRKGWVRQGATWPLLDDAQVAAYRKAVDGTLVPDADYARVQAYIHALGQGLVDPGLSEQTRAGLALARLSALEAVARHLPSVPARLQSWVLAFPGLLESEDGGSARVPASAYLHVAQSFSGQPLADRLAWSATQQMLREPCEKSNDVVCALQRVLGREGGYLGVQPSGRHAAEALTGIASVLERFSPGACGKAPDNAVTRLGKILEPVAETPQRKRALTALDRCK